MSKNEQLNPEKNTEERNENALRPLYLQDFLGQEKLKENLEIFIKAAKNRGDVLDHSLFFLLLANILHLWPFFNLPFCHQTNQLIF